MKLYEVLHRIVNELGADKYYDKHLINYISDYSSEALQPISVKNVFKYILENEYPMELIERSDFDPKQANFLISKFTLEIANKTGYSKNLISYVLNSIAYSFNIFDKVDDLDTEEVEEVVDNGGNGLQWYGTTPQKKDKNHLYFKDVQIFGDAKSFVDKMCEKGYTIIQEDSDEKNYMLNGTYAGIPSKLVVQISPITHRTSRIIVLLDDDFYKKWPALKEIYYILKNKLINKYGKPSSVTEAFFPPHKDGDGNEIELLDSYLGSYQSKFDVDGGQITLLIASEARVLISFSDTLGCNELNREFEQSAQDDM